MDQDFELPSGGKLHVSVAPFQDAKALTKALLKASGMVKLAENPMDMDVSVIKDMLVQAATSDEVEAALFRCMSRATYDNLKITPELFDDQTIGDKIRRDYFLVCAKVVEVNCLPFFDQALSSLKTFLTKKSVTPESK